MQIIKRPFRAVIGLWQRRHFLLSHWFGAPVPVHTLSWMPDGFRVQAVGETGVRVADNFVRPEESVLLIEAARNVLTGQSGSVTNDIRKSGMLCLDGRGGDDPAILPLLYRSGLLFGLPYTHAERIVVARVGEDADSAMLATAAPDCRQGAKHSVLIFLNEVPGDAGGDTVFESLRFSVCPRVGRAVCWSVHSVAHAEHMRMHEAPPVVGSAEKWVVQIWFGNRPLRVDAYGPVNPPQAAKGVPLDGSEAIRLDNVWKPETIDLEAVFGQPDKMEGLL